MGAGTKQLGGESLEREYLWNPQEMEVGVGARKAATGSLLQGCGLGCVAGIITYCIETTSVFITVSPQPQFKIKIFTGPSSLLEIQAAKGLLA